jgi:hypothetical protein
MLMKLSYVSYSHWLLIIFIIEIYIVARIVWQLYKTGIGLTTGFIGSHTVTHNYSVYASQLTTIESILLV